MKRGLTILTAALFASALALPAMAQSTDSGSKPEEAPAASAVANPNPAGAENAAAQPSADDSSAKAGNEEMKPADKSADDASVQPQSGGDQSDANTASDSGSNGAGTSAEGHQVQ